MFGIDGTPGGRMAQVQYEYGPLTSTRLYRPSLPWSATYIYARYVSPLSRLTGCCHEVAELNISPESVYGVDVLGLNPATPICADENTLILKRSCGSPSASVYDHVQSGRNVSILAFGPV